MSQPIRILLALFLGLGAGVFAASAMPDGALAAIDFVQPVGTIWLNALRMTIVPLVVSLLIVGIAATAEAAQASKLATRSIAIFVGLLWLSSSIGALVTFGLLDAFPLGAGAAAALRATFDTAQPVGDVPGFGEFLTGLVPTNPVAAAAEDAFLPLIVFTAVFAFAVTRLPDDPRRLLTGFFRAIADAMLIVIGWILWLAPIGVAALAYVVGARAGTAAFGALIHYVLVLVAVGIVMTLIAYPVAILGGRVRPARFIREAGPPQALALSTQSSLACLPAMLKATERLGVPVATSGVVLPLAVAIFRYTGPPMNLAVAIYVAHVFGIELGPTQIAAGIAAAAITTMGSVSLPGQISFISAIAPITVAMGVPIEPLALLVAVETLPDIWRTIGNVTMNVGVTGIVAERVGKAPRSEADALLEG